MRRIGILGGTFDPVHNGHLLLGEQAYREYGLDEIWFMPSHVPPHKKDHLITDGAARIRMLELATESIPYFTVSDFEMGREGNTYTAQTLALLKEAYPDIEVYFIIGADSLYQLESWYHPEQVMAQAVLLVSGRTYEDGGVPLEDKVAYFNEKYNADIRILHNPKIDVASADIRKKAAEGRDLSKDMPAAVAEAKSVLDTTRDPQLSDIVLDRWMYRDMAQVAEVTGSEFLRGYVAAQIDAANLRALIRTLRMGKNGDFLAGVLFEGGEIEPAAVLALANDRSGLAEVYGATRFAQAAEAGEAALKGGSLTEFEKRCDDAVSDYLAGAQMIPFGEAPMLAYLAARETEYTNIRILLMGRAAGLSPEVIRSRLRRTCA